MPEKSKSLLKKTFNKDLNQILDSKDDKRTFSFEVTLIEGCNWRCEYCFEGEDKITGKKNLLNKDPDTLIQSIKSILNDPWFDETFDGMNTDS
jgi:sulfatase maturation enzyme AslB (radical SAM superfamily)